MAKKAQNAKKTNQQRVQLPQVPAGKKRAPAKKAVAAKVRATDVTPAMLGCLQKIMVDIDRMVRRRQLYIQTLGGGELCLRHSLLCTLRKLTEQTYSIVWDEGNFEGVGGSEYAAICALQDAIVHAYKALPEKPAADEDRSAKMLRWAVMSEDRLAYSLFAIASGESRRRREAEPADEAKADEAADGETAPDQDPSDDLNLWVNPDGNWGVGIGRNVGHFDVEAVCEAAGIPRDKIMVEGTNDYTAEAAAVIEAATDKAIKDFCNPEQQEFVMRVRRLQKLHPGDRNRFDIWGERPLVAPQPPATRAPCIYLDTLLHGATDGKSEDSRRLWSLLADLCIADPRTTAVELCAGPITDESSPDYGRPVKTVALRWHLDDLSDDEVVELVKTATPFTQAVWDLGGDDGK